MSLVVVVLLLLAGLSEAAGRILPLMARRSNVPRPIMVGLLLTGSIVEGAVFALWPLAAWTLAVLMPSAPSSASTALTWTPGLVAPLVFAAVFAFPLLGPMLHLLLFVGVGTGLVTPLAVATGLDWWAAAGCVAIAGAGLAAAVGAVRRLVGKISATGAQEQVP